MIKACAVFNMVIGGLAMFAGVNLTLLGWVLGGRSPAVAFEALFYFAPLAAAGFLYGVSGLFLWQSPEKVPGKAVLFQGMAVVAAILYCVVLFAAIPQEQRTAQDEEVLLFLFVPASMVLFAVIEWAFLSMACSKGRGITTG